MYLFAIIAITLMLFFYIKSLYENATYLKYNDFSDDNNRNKHKNSILLVCSNNGPGGGVTHIINLFNSLREQNTNVHILTKKTSATAEYLNKNKISFYECNSTIFRFLGIRIQSGYFLIKKICKNHRINVIHFNEAKELKIAKMLSKNLDKKIVFTRHVPLSSKTKAKYIKNADIIIGVSSYISNGFCKKNTEENLKIKKITHIPPLMNDKKFKNFKPSKDKLEFFRDKLGIQLSETSIIICFIANMYKDPMHKNHHVLFRALKLLISKNKYAIHLMLAGDGVGKTSLMKLAEELSIKNNVHFLGFTKEIPSIIYHSNINVLSSSKEAFGLVVLEAAFMKKTSIVTQGIGANDLIKHNETGLIFRNNDETDLVEKIETLIKDPVLCKKLGENAYKIAEENFSGEILAKKHIGLYQEICS